MTTDPDTPASHHDNRHGPRLRLITAAASHAGAPPPDGAVPSSVRDTRDGGAPLSAARVRPAHAPHPRGDHITTTTEPDAPHLPEPDPGRDRLLHRLATGALGLAFLGYVFHRHPAFRETAVAVGGVGTFLLAAVLAARSRR